MFKFRSFFLPVSLVLVIFAALALTSPVHAQETEQPPDLPVETPILMDEMSPPIEEQPVVDQTLVPEEIHGCSTRRSCRGDGGRHRA